MPLKTVFDLPHSEVVSFTAGEVANALGATYHEGLNKGYNTGVSKGAVLVISGLVTGVILGLGIYTYTEIIKPRKKI